MGRIVLPNFISMISLVVRVFQWLLKESMRHLCNSLFTFINLSHKQGQSWAEGTYYIYWSELNYSLRLLKRSQYCVIHGDQSRLL